MLLQQKVVLAATFLAANVVIVALSDGDGGGSVMSSSDASCAAAADDGTSAAAAAAAAAAPTILRNGELITLDDDLFSTSSSGSSNGDDDESSPSAFQVADIPGGGSVQLRYVRSFLSEREVTAAIEFCDARNGWTESRQTLEGDGSAQTTARTSSSCPLFWPLLYLPRLEQLRESGQLTPAWDDEIKFAWKIMQRVADFLDVDAARIEPLQLIRYEPGQFYRRHHDHGSYYGAATEQRPVTFLLFLSSVPASSGGGGHTKFGDLDLAVLPRAGDGIVWRNVDDAGNLILEAVHEAVPPRESGNVRKFAMNVWIAEKKIMDIYDAASYRTS